MKQMLNLTMPHAVLRTRPDEGCSLVETAIKFAREYKDNGGDDLQIDSVDVADRVFDRAHNTKIKSFDALLNKNQGTFMTGNVWGDAQVSGFVRAVDKTECNGMTFAPGALRNADVALFKQFKNDFNPIERWLKDHPSGDVIIYALRNKVRNEQVFGRGVTPVWRLYGFIVTDPNHKLLYRHYDGPDRRACDVLDEAEHFLTTAHEENPTPLLRISNGNLECLTPEVQLEYDEYGAHENSSRSMTDRGG